MAFVIPNVGKVTRLTAAQAASASWQVCLYTNSVTWGNATVIGDITEATFAGYARTNPTFAAAAVVSNKGSSTAGVLTYTITASSQTVNGYYILDSGGNLLGGEVFSSPVALNVTGLSVLKLTLTQTEDTD